MAIIRYSDADRERMRQEQEALRAERRRERLFFEFLRETGRMGVPDSRPISEQTIDKIRSLGLDPTSQNMSNVGRPIRLVDHGAQPIREILA